MPLKDLFYNILILMGTPPELCLFRVSSPCFELLLFLPLLHNHSKLILRFTMASMWFVCCSYFPLLLELEHGKKTPSERVILGSRKCLLVSQERDLSRALTASELQGEDGTSLQQSRREQSDCKEKDGRGGEKSQGEVRLDSARDKGERELLVPSCQSHAQPPWRIQSKHVPSAQNEGCGTPKKHPKKPGEEAGGLAKIKIISFRPNVYFTEADGEVRDRKFHFECGVCH